MSGATFPAWYHQRFASEIDGHMWTTDGAMMVRTACEPTEKPIPSGASGLMRSPTVADAQPGAEENGWTQMGACWFGAHRLRWISRLFPGVSWRVGGSWSDPALALIGGDVVAVIMPARPKDDGSAPHKSGLPPCVACNGSGWEKHCGDCDGSGRVDCFHCGHETDCDSCDGEGGIGTCKACDGQKLDRSEAA